jgi:Protein of unknown function (DUF1572)
MNTIATEFLASASKRLLYYKELGDKALAILDTKDCHFTPNQESNSIAVIIQHLSGNMLSRWTDFLTTDGEKEWRNRDEEFEIKERSKEQLSVLWEKGWACSLDAIKNLKEEDLLKTIYIRGEGLLVLDAINRQLAHYPYHVGQIIYIAKMIKGDGWESLSIAKNKSAAFNLKMKPSN